jgi:hypothetical protein
MEVIDLVISISLVLLLGAAVFVAWRYTGLRIWQAIICVLFGFYLAQTSAAPQVRQLVSNLINVLSSGQH